jgi:hypothetical protein
MHPTEAAFPSMVFSPYSKITSFTPNPPKALLLDFHPFGTSDRPSENVEHVRSVNKNTDGFMLHRRPRAPLQETNGAMSPFAEEFVF